MRSSLTSGVSTLRRQLDLADALRALAATPLPPEILGEALERVLAVQANTGSPADLARYHYNATVVGLYGLLERGVEDLIAEAVQLLSKAIPRHTDLPDKAKVNHLPLTLDVLVALQAGRFRGSATIGELVSTLHRSMTDPSGVWLNESAFVHHTANFRADVVRSSFERLGLSIVQALDGDEKFASAVEQNFPDEPRYFVIDDLAERRNEVAHGATPQQLLTTEILRAYLVVVERYFDALTRAVSDWLTGITVKHHGVPLGRPTKVFGQSIAGYSSMPTQVAVGDYVAAVT